MKSWHVLVAVFVTPLVGDAETRTPFDSPRPTTKDPAPNGSRGGYKGLGAGSVAPDEVAKFAAPPLDPAVRSRIEAMMDVREAGNGVTTSKGDRMFFESRVTGVTQVWRQDGPMKLAVQLTGGEDKTSLAGLSPDDKWLALSRDSGGEENPGLYLQSVQGGPLQVVQHAPKVQTTLEHISDDSKWLVYRANDIEQESYALYRYDLATRKKERVFDQPGLWSLADLRGDTWLLKKRLGNRVDEIYSYALATKQLTPVIGQGETEVHDAVFGAKPGQLFVRTNKLGEFHRLYTLEHGKLTPITPDVKADVEAWRVDRARTRIYYQLNERGYSKLFVLDAKTLKPIATPPLPPAENVVVTSVSRDGRFVHLQLDGSAQIPEAATWDWQTKRLVTWRIANTPEIDPKAFAKATLESYPARDGTQVPMFVRRPAKCAAGVATAPCPVVVDFHGGPEQQSRPRFSAQSQLLVDAGFIVVEPNVRGSEGYGKTYNHADDGPKRLAVVTDIEDVAKHIRATWAVGGKAPKIGVVGGSYGGYSVLMGMTYFAGAYDAGVQRVGISNLLSFLENTAAYRRILRISEYGDPVKDRDALIQLSPITHVKKIKAPLLSIQGVNDPRVPVGEALQIFREAASRKIPGGLILFPDEGHSIAKRSNRVLAMGHTLAFFEKHLK